MAGSRFWHAFVWLYGADRFDIDHAITAGLRLEQPRFQVPLEVEDSLRTFIGSDCEHKPPLASTT